MKCGEARRQQIYADEICRTEAQTSLVKSFNLSDMFTRIAIICENITGIRS